MRLVDVDIVDDVIQNLNENHNRGITRNDYKMITGVLYEMPTVDAVEVVRCKECKWYKDFDGCFFSTTEVKEDDFCSYGERKTDCGADMRGEKGG